ncbi:MAG: penicillin-binding protein 1A [Gammaproteobacteria bacterium]
MAKFNFIKHAGLTLFSLAITLFIVLLGFVVYFETQLPDVDLLKDNQLQIPLQIYTLDNKLIGEFGPERRNPIPINEVPKQLIQAILATEDQRFFEHSGVDPIGLLRAAVAFAKTGEKAQGGSTITMQVARNYFLSSQKTMGRKIKEILLAIKIDSEFSKDKILELYLNKIYLGNRAYGVEAAAQVYYGKSLSQLTLPEFAMLAGLPKAPSSINPIANPIAAKARRNHVLYKMYERHYINKATYLAAIATPVTTKYHGLPIEIQANYVADMVMDAMHTHYGEKALTEGYKVYTTIDSRLQSYANSSLHNAILAYDQRHGYHRPLGKSNNPNESAYVDGALVAVNPQNGAILALVGGYDYKKSNFNRVTQAERQSGSSFKPFIYAAALDKGYTLASIINDSPIVLYDPSLGGLWRPQNENHKFNGPVRLRVALTSSMNLASIRLLQNIGIRYAVNYLERFGFNSTSLPHSLSLVLGSADVTPLQMTYGFAVFANGGYRVTPFVIQKIVDNHNNLIYQAKPKVACVSCQELDQAMENEGEATISTAQQAPRVISPETAYLMTSALQDVIRSGTGRAALVLNRPDLAGKTGTSNSQVDAWFIGFNSDIVATAWVGFDSPKSIKEFGSQVSLPMWINFMSLALKDKPLHTLSQPSNISILRIDPKTGYLARENQSNAIYEYFQTTNAPQQTATEEAPAENTDTTNTQEAAEPLF